MLSGVPASAKASGEHEAGRRAALIVGNHLYRSVPALKNAVNDSDAVATALRQLGFEVTSASDVDLATFKSTIDAFEKSAEGADSVVFYFSGHGFQLNGVNYLVPVDATLKARDEIESETIRLDSIIAKLQRPDRQTLVFLDACRNNPLPEAMRADGGQGLAQIETGAGTFVAFATQPGNVALDGAGEHSYFTDALLKNVGTPGISISDMMIRVRNSVETATLGQQTPWDQSSLRSQFYFKPQQEESAALTDEDRELLLSLDPALRKKFESRFGIRIDEAFAPAGDDAGDSQDGGQADNGGDAAAAGDAEADATIVPNIVINDAAGDAEAAQPGKDESGKAPEVAALSPQESAPAAPSLIIMDPEEPAKPEAGAAEAPAPDADGADTAEPSGPPIPTARPDYSVASAEPEEDAPPAPETQTASAPVTAAPAPTESSPVVVARAKPAPANPASTAPSSAATVKQATASASAASSGAVAVASPAQSESASAAPGEAVRIAPRQAAESAASSASSEIVVASAGAADSLRPASREIERMVGQEVAPDVVAGDAIPAARPVETPPAVADVSAQPANPPASQEPVPAVAPAAVPVVAEAAKQPAAEPSKPAEPESSIQVASVEPAPDKAATANKPEISVPENPIPQPDAADEQTDEQRRETARAIQGELTRLGCYRSAIDGSWGQSSAKGLLRYFATKKEAPDALDPTPELLARLSDEPNVVCQRTETATPEKPRPQKRTVERAEKPARQNAANRPAKAQQKVAREERPSGGGGGKKIKKITGLGGF